MKNKILFGAMLLSFCTFSLQSNAQIKVASTGKVGVCIADTVEPLSKLTIGNQGSTQWGISIDMSNPSDNPVDEWNNIHSVVRAQYDLPTWHYSVIAITQGLSDADRLTGLKAVAYKTEGDRDSGRSHGVIGTAGMATDGWNYGVTGNLTGNSTKGTGIYGCIYDGLDSYIEGRYAGYFYGQTKVNGDFYATTVTTTSDARLKTNIAGIDTKNLHKIQALRPIQFTWQQVEDMHDTDTATVKRMYFPEDIEYDRTHYGFLAQDVQKLFPELVHEDGDGYLSVTYMELIPLLVQAIQDLSAEVEELKASKYAKSPAFTANRPSEDALQAILYQNQPNPFSAETQIGYQLPQTTRSATLYIYTMNGSQLAEYPITTFGEGHVVVSAGTLEAGMYLYSLIADGQVIDTKRMILTK